LDIRHGKPTRVRNYWREGNLGVLAALARYPGTLPADFPVNLLALRSLLAPAYTQLAVERASGQVADFLKPYQQLEDDARVFTRYDWELQLELAVLSGNPVFILIYNSFTGLYQVLGEIYFQHPDYRALSQRFYRNLYKYALAEDAVGAGKLVRETMQSSQMLWQGLHYESAGG
jgi:GntR family negative regulator for fad regulon and positive regulator of fabA